MPRTAEEAKLRLPLRYAAIQPTKWDAFERVGRKALSTRPYLRSGVAHTANIMVGAEPRPAAVNGELRREAIHMEQMPWKGRWRLVASVVLIPMLCYVVLRLIRRHTFLATMTVDNFALFGATIFAAALGFGAVLLQIRSSAAQLRQQSIDQHESARRDQQRQAAAIANALLVEVDDFAANYLAGLDKLLSGIDVVQLSREQLPQLESHPESRFEIYDGNVGRLGEFDQTVVRAVVRFYKTACEHLATYRDYQAQFDRLQKGNKSGEAYEEARYSLEIVARSAKTLLKLADDARHALNEATQLCDSRTGKPGYYIPDSHNRP